VSELEHALREALADPPAELPDGVRHPLWDIEERIHRRRQKQRRGAVAALACAAVAAVVVPLSVYGSPGGSQMTNGDSKAASAGNGGAVAAAPAAVRRAADKAAHAAGTRADRTVQWVRTTMHDWDSQQGRALLTLTGQQIYVVKLTGRFVDDLWNPPAGPGHYKADTVPTELVVISVHNGKVTTVQHERMDLPKLGAVHTFTLH
jgi:hypothetical protein